MNCQDFESMVGDLARGVPVEATAQTEARAHEGVCARCAARLSDERALSAGLRGLAARAEAEAAPPRVEANLLAAFRAHAAAGAPGRAEAPAATANAGGKVVPLARPSAQRRWSWAKSVAASATAAAAAVALFVLVAPRRPGPTGVATTPSSAPAGAANHTLQTARPPLAVSPPPVEVSGGGPQGEVAGVSPHVPRPSRAHTARPPVRGTTPASYRGGTPRYSQAGRGPGAGELEIATDFIPLTQDARAALAEGGQVVRVELPRTALQRFGLPMNVEQAGGRVKADVMLGYDGVARAIRFVR